jgi:ABC-type glycerol-3-phosphate transport system substrate-binding protein
MSKFQIIVLCLFGFFVIGGLVAFSLYNKKADPLSGPVYIWGTVDQTLMGKLIADVRKANQNKINVFYTQFREETFDSQFLEALATGRGPDAILVSQDMLLRNYNKLLAIPYNSYSEADFKGTFVQEGQLYLDSAGVVGIPFAINPMVMYWNRDMFTNANIPRPPKSWEEFLALAPTLTVKDQTGTISQSAVGLGEFRNISYARDILSLLMIQAGNPIVVRTKDNIAVTLNSQISNNGVSAADSALTFYTQFANPVKQVYTWNRSLKNSKDLFVANKLAVFFGYASDYNDIRQKNPNLNFDVAIVPQITAQANTNTVKSTYGKMYGLSIVRSAKDPLNTASILYLLTSKDSNDLWTKSTGLPSVRLDSLNADPANAVSGVFTTSALWSKSWLDPNKAESDKIFQDMIENVTSERKSNSEALKDADSRLRELFNN